MSNAAEKLEVNQVSDLQSEIRQLVEETSNDKEKLALRCFERAMRPLIQDPERLRTMLGKIMQMEMYLPNDLEFSSEDELHTYMKAHNLEAVIE